MKSAHGVIQGYDGVAAVDAKHQVIVHAEAWGEAQEHELLVPMVEGTRDNFQAIGKEQNWTCPASVDGFPQGHLSGLEGPGLKLILITERPEAQRATTAKVYNLVFGYLHKGTLCLTSEPNSHSKTLSASSSRTEIRACQLWSEGFCN